MPSTSAERELKLPAISMSLEQFRAFLRRARSHFASDNITTIIGIKNGIAIRKLDTIEELTADDHELPDTINTAHVYFGVGGPKYVSSQYVEINFANGATITRNNAAIVGLTSGWVESVSHAISQDCWRRATIQGYFRLRFLLWFLVPVVFGISLGRALSPVLATSKPPYNILLTWQQIVYCVSLLLIAVFTYSDKLYLNSFPTTVIVVRIGPRRWPYEIIMLLVGIVGLVVSLVH